MPEGPSIVILKDEVAKFARRRVLGVEGNTRIDLERLRGRTVRAIKSHGKHFLLDFGRFALRVHFLLWGTYRIDERKPDKPVRLGLRLRTASSTSTRAR